MLRISKNIRVPKKKRILEYNLPRDSMLRRDFIVEGLNIDFYLDHKLGMWYSL